MSIMNALQNNKLQGTTSFNESAATISAEEISRSAKPIGTFSGSTDFVLRFRNGELVAENTGDQGGGQN
jgi:hypothetical protein